MPDDTPFRPTFGIWTDTRAILPRAGLPVLVTLRTPQPCVILAQYAPPKTLPMHPEWDGNECVYDEALDEFFAPEGWYQCYAVNGALDDEPFWRLHDEVTHWMPRPEPAE
jgi:hypothetical protein